MVFDGPVGPARLTVACLDCARFDDRSPTALVAAAASSAPYAMVLGLAAVSVGPPPQLRAPAFFFFFFRRSTSTSSHHSAVALSPSRTLTPFPPLFRPPTPPSPP